MDGHASLDRFQAHCKWEKSGRMFLGDWTSGKSHVPGHWVSWQGGGKMTGRTVSRFSWGDSEETREQDDSLTPSPRRWTKVVAIVVCAAIGLGLLGFLSRRFEQSASVRSPQEPQQPEKFPSGDSMFAETVVVTLPATADELVAEGKRLADELMASFPDSPQALLLGGRIFDLFGDLDKAEDCWEKCLELAPEFAPAWYHLGEAASLQGEYGEAVKCLEKAIQYDPSRYRMEVVPFLADSLMNIGKAEEAVAVMEKAAAVGPLPMEGLTLLGNGYLELKDFEKAKQKFEEALAIDRNSASLHYALARTFAGLREPEKARQHREEYARLTAQRLAGAPRARAQLRARDAADVRPLARECYLATGEFYAEHNNKEQAERLWLKAAAVDPRSAKPRRLLEQLYRLQGRPESAVLIMRGIASEGR